MKGQWNKCLEAVCFILQSPQADQMVGAVFFVFNVAVEHGGVRFQADLMSSPRRVEPLVAINFVVADYPAYAFVENLCAAPRKGIQAGLLELLQRFCNR